MPTRRYLVAVFDHYEGPRSHRPNAYLRDWQPGWKGLCLHEVDADTGPRAKRIAIREHCSNHLELRDGYWYCQTEPEATDV
jgi:hypothetical protein